MNIKRILAFGLATVGVAALLVQPVAAQGRRPMGPPPAGGQSQKMDIGKILNLTAAQQAKIKKIDQSYGSKLKAILSDKKLTQAQKQAKVEPIAKKMQAEINKVLTPAQRKKLASLRNPLNLTPAQQTKIGKIQSSYRGKIQAILGNKSLTQAQKQAKVEPIVKKMGAEINKVLTPAQKKKIAAMRGPAGAPSRGPRPVK